MLAARSGVLWWLPSGWVHDPTLTDNNGYTVMAHYAACMRSQLIVGRPWADVTSRELPVLAPCWRYNAIGDQHDPAKIFFGGSAIEVAATLEYFQKNFWKQNVFKIITEVHASGIITPEYRFGPKYPLTLSMIMTMATKREDQ
jgi:hypothetical protein